MVEEYPLKYVVDWVGHDIKVAAKHYLDSSSEEHHQKAVLGHEKAVQNPVHAVTERVGNGLKTRKRQENRKAASAYSTITCGVIPGNAPFAYPQEVGDEGLEEDSVSGSNAKTYAKHPSPSDVESDVISDALPILTRDGETLNAPLSCLEPSLRFVVQHWPDLPESDQRTILRLIGECANAEI